MRRTLPAMVMVIGLGVLSGSVLGHHNAAQAGDPWVPPSNYSVEQAASFPGHGVYYAGTSVSGQALSRTYKEFVSGFGLPDDNRSIVGFVYGYCEPDPAEHPGEGQFWDDSCVPPIEISNWPACARNFSLYTTWLSAKPSSSSTIRSAPAKWFENGTRLEIQTGTTTIVVFGRDETETLGVAAALTGLNIDVPAGTDLPPPASGAVEGTLSC